MAGVNTTMSTTIATGEETGGSSVPAPGSEVEMIKGEGEGENEEVEDEEEDEDEGEGEEDEEDADGEAEWLGDGSEEDDEEEDEEDDQESEDVDEDEDVENEDENVDTSDGGHWKDSSPSQYIDREGDFDVKTLLERKEKNQSGLLFRAVGPQTGQNGSKHPNVDYEILNTEASVVPHRFARRHVQPGKKRGHSSLLAMPRRRLIRMLQHHTYGKEDGRSEVSSWTHSLLAAINFAQRNFNLSGRAYIHIIDRAQVKNDIIHNADIRRSFGNKAPVHTLFPTEWIVHGVVDGPGHWLVKFRKIKSDLPLLRLPTQYIGFPWMGREERQAIHSAMNASQVTQDLNLLSATCKSLATTMMQNYKAKDTPRAKLIQLRLQTTLYCMSPRFTHTEIRAGLNEAEHQDLIKAMGDLTATPGLLDYIDVVSDQVFTHADFPDVTQTRHFLRMLAWSKAAASQVEEVKRKALKRKLEREEERRIAALPWEEYLETL